MLILLNLAVIAALACLVFFQTNRSILIRSAGLLVILAAELVFSFQASAMPNIGFLIAMTCLFALGLASDYYMATLRTWSFRTSEQTVWGLGIGGFIACPIMFYLFPSILIFLVFSVVGAIIGDIRANGYRSVNQLFKSTVGTFVGVFGLSTKLLMGIEMAYWFVFMQVGSMAGSSKSLQMISLL